MGRSKMKTLWLGLAFLAAASADPSILQPNAGQFANNFNQVDTDQATAREAQNYATIDDYNAPVAPVLGPSNDGVRDDLNSYVDPNTITSWEDSEWQTVSTGSDPAWQAYPYPAVPKQPNNALGLPDIFYNGLILILAALAILESYQLVKSLWALKLTVWDSWIPNKARNLDPAIFELIKHSIDEASLKFIDYIQDQ